MNNYFLSILLLNIIIAAGNIVPSIEIKCINKNVMDTMQKRDDKLGVIKCTYSI